MAKFYEINYENLFKTLIRLNELGIYITTADGHYWIHYETLDYSDFGKLLEKNGVLLNNKIYNGFIEAIATAAQALELCDVKLDLTFDDGELFPSGYAADRIACVERGKGGLC
jgi:hypothetical protein